jgi:membrane-bound ClpP family serine protease
MELEQPSTGARGRASTPMVPSGKVLIDGIAYNARLKSGSAESGDEVVVVGHGFGLIVEKPDSLAKPPQCDPNDPQ